MWGTHIGRAYKAPFRIKPEFGKVGQDSVKPNPKVSWDVLQDCVVGLYSANDVSEHGPEVAFVVGAEHVPCGRERLAWVSAANKVNSRSWFTSPPLHCCVHVIMLRNRGPMLFKHGSAEWVDLHLADDCHSGTFKAQLKPTDSGEQA